MNQKILRVTLLIPMIIISVFIGITVTTDVTVPISHSHNQMCNNEDIGSQIPGNYRIIGALGPQACSCLGVTYSDDVPPSVVVMSPPNNSLIFPNTTIYIECSDNFPAIDGGVPFVPEYVYYHWNNATSNTTAYDAGVDGAPPNDQPVKLEFVLPSDEAGVTHKLYIYAVDYEKNWTSVVVIYTTPSTGEESSVTWTTTTTTTTTIQRRTDGFLLIPMIGILIGLVNIITWRRRKNQ